MCDTRRLPPYLSGITKIYIDAGVEDSVIAKRVREKLGQLPVTVVAPGQGVTRVPKSGQALYLKDYKGTFLRFCPGTRYYRCCGYRIIHIGENCPLRCSYCILQAYFQDPVLKVWANQDDLWKELDTAFSRDPRQRFRVGTGEYTDSLVLEPLTGYSRDLVAFLGNYENVCLELKSKVVDLSWMDAVKRPDRVLPAWSLNAPYIASHEELGESASLEKRLQAARQCVENGFRVCLHFDPMIHYPGWERGYEEIVAMIFDYVSPEDIAYMSMGSFRCMPELKTVIERDFPESRYIYDEFITGVDGKQRLLRTLRVEQFNHLVALLRRYGMDRQLYFCMESDTVWREVMGYTVQDLGGLSRHLLDCAFAGRGG
ncbi:spore photoproduct lyase family protein [Desulfoplanes sp.]